MSFESKQSGGKAYLNHLSCHAHRITLVIPNVNEQYLMYASTNEKQGSRGRGGRDKTANAWVCVCVCVLAHSFALHKSDFKWSGSSFICKNATHKFKCHVFLLLLRFG